MMNTKENLGEFISTIHNPESVVEVYFDKEKKQINEVKCLNYNRYKVYNYSLSDYSEHISKHNLELPAFN